MKFRCAMRTALLITGIMLVGCAGSGPDQPETKPSAPPPAPPSSDGSEEQWIPDQGTHILGSGPDVLGSGPGYISVSTTPAFRTKFTVSVMPAIAGAHLTATDGTTTYSQNHTWFNDLILTASDGGQVKIIGSAEVFATAPDLNYKVVEDAANTEWVANAVASTEYTLLYRKPKMGGGFEDWKDYCGDDGGAAVPVAGHYGGQRDHLNGRISFACHNGIAFKCTMWGFPTGPGLTIDPDAWDLHTACTGMGNARYCGDAHSFTREMTPVWIVDQKNGSGIDNNAWDLMHPGDRGDRWPGNPDVFYIEAGWKRDGTPLCLSKLRWVSLPPNPCRGVLNGLEDPREVVRSDEHPDVFFCDGNSVTQLFNLGAVLINGSMMMDAPIGRWETSGGEKVSTIRGVWVDANKDGFADPETVFPLIEGGASSSYTTFDRYDGMLLRNLTGTLTEDQMVPLYMQNFGAIGDHYMSSTGPGRSDPSFEGYSFVLPDTEDNEGEHILGDPFNQCKWANSDNDNHLDTRSIRCSQVTPLGFAFPAP
jgi:hypothetical protein